jgi:hypothetical protein
MAANPSDLAVRNDHAAQRGDTASGQTDDSRRSDAAPGARMIVVSVLEGKLVTGEDRQLPDHQYDLGPRRPSATPSHSRRYSPISALRR